MEIRDEEVACPLREGALKTPEVPAVVGASGSVDYAELDARVSDAVHRLREMGCETGTRVALYLPSDERCVVLLMALLRIGAVACPLSTRLPLQRVPSLVRRTACFTLVSDDERLPGAVGPDALGMCFGEPTGVEKARDQIQLPLNRGATIVFTSGSIGRPKAALHTFGNHYYSALGSGTNIALSGNDRWLLSLPLYHVGGLSIVFRCLLAGATIAIPEPGMRLGHSIAGLEATHVSLVATQLRRLLEERVDLSGLKTILLGGGPVPDLLVEEAVSRDLPVHTSYGLTEMASQVTTTPPGASSAVLRTAGRILPHRDLSISEEGEVLVRGETLFAGYVEGAELELPTDEAGWFHTGDLGHLDREGYLRIRGRKDNLFVSGGENIQPEEIEDSLARLEGVERAVVVPVTDADFGERPVAFVLLPADGSVGLDGLASALEEELPRFKIPVAFYEWPEDADPGRAKVNRAFFRARALRIYGGL